MDMSTLYIGVLVDFLVISWFPVISTDFSADSQSIFTDFGEGVRFVVDTSTQANHRFLSIKQVANKSWNWFRRYLFSSWEVVILSSLQELDAENAFTLSVSFEIGMKEWSLRIPGIVYALKNRCSSCLSSAS